jgi:Mn2+/Fe2+ NRAMP family transporter
VILLIPMLVVVQVASAQVGVVARKGLEDAVTERLGRVWGWDTMLAVLSVTLVTLAADLEGGGAALGLLSGLPYQWFMAPCALAAAALAPVAGQYASLLFGVGLLASAALAVPVLAGTGAYVVAELFNWRADLDASFQRAPRFYAVLLGCLGAALVLAYLGISPIQLLFVASIAGGLATPLTLAMLLLVGRNRRIMGEHQISLRLRVAGWLVFAAVTAAGVAYLAQSLFGGS